MFRALGWHLELGPEIALDSRLNYIGSHQARRPHPRDSMLFRETDGTDHCFLICAGAPQLLY